MTVCDGESLREIPIGKRRRKNVIFNVDAELAV